MRTTTTGTASPAGGPNSGPNPGIDGRHVLAGLLAFFACVFAVNGTFIVLAVSTHTGVVSQEPYRKGLAYNDRIAADARQTALGWREALTLTSDGWMVLNLADRDNRSVPALRIKASVGRPSTVSHDRAVTLNETADGQYAADIGNLDSGNWVVAIEAWRIGEREPAFRLRRRLWLKP
jgi:nitrogen fixation protein FixH